MPAVSARTRAHLPDTRSPRFRILEHEERSKRGEAETNVQKIARSPRFRARSWTASLCSQESRQARSKRGEAETNVQKKDRRRHRQRQAHRQPNGKGDGTLPKQTVGIVGRAALDVPGCLVPLLVAPPAIIISMLQIIAASYVADGCYLLSFLVKYVQLLVFSSRRFDRDAQLLGSLLSLRDICLWHYYNI